jgi:Domain of unknown function (DUF4111)
VSVSLTDLPERAARGWAALRDEARAILGPDLVALWGYGGTTFADRPDRLGDLDTFAVLRREPDEDGKRALERAEAGIALDHGIEWDTWYAVAADAARSEPPPHALDAARRATSWAIDRAHWFAGRYVPLFGSEPVELVPRPTWREIETALSRELEHLERHVLEGDDDPYEATYAIWNGSRILRAVETQDVAVSKRAGGMWALEHLPERWHKAIRAADRTYDGHGTAEDAELLRASMGPFVVMVRERLPLVEPRAPGEPPRWGGS